MRILITTDAYLPMVNGVVTSVLSLCGELTALGHEVKVLALSGTKKAYREGEAYYLPAFNANLVYPDARIAACLRHEYISELVAWSPHVVHSQSEFTSFHFARVIAKKAHAPLVHTYHTLYDEYTHYFFPNKRIGKKAVSTIMHRLGARVNWFIAPSEKTRSALLHYKVASPITVVPTGINLELFATPLPKKERAQMRARLGINEDEKVLLSLGRVAKEKNIEKLIKFTASYQGENVKLVVVGAGPALSALQQMVAAGALEDKVVFTGMVLPRQVPAYYKMADVFVCASTSETQGLTYIEALASGLPEVCFEDECLIGVLENGENGYLFNDEKSYHEGVQKLFASEGAYAAAAQNARQSAAKFSSAAFAANALEVYKQAVQAF